MAIFSLTKLPSCRHLLVAAGADKLLLKWSQHSAKLKVNCTNALKNLTSDAAEAIEEGTVAALIAISLEVSSCVTLLCLFHVTPNIVG